MSVSFPQAVMTLRILWEDFGLKSDASLQKVYSLPVLCQRVNVHLNDYAQADTFDAQIDYKNFPFDPRLIRACGVTIHMEDKGQVFRGDNRLDLIEPRMPDDPDSNCVFMGFVDEENISFDDDNRTVRFEGRDFTAILIDTKYLEGKPIDMGTPLDQLIQQLLSQVKSTQELKVDNRTGTTLPTLKQFFPDFGQPLAGQKNTGKDDTYWEIIQDVVTRAGLICFVELDKLVISTPRVLYDKTNAKRFIYGKNIKNLRMKRKLGRQKGFNVRVRYLDLETKKVSTVDIPEQASEAFTTRTGFARKRIQIPQVMPNGQLGDPKDAPFSTFRVTNVKNEDHLKELGEKIFEEMSVQQIEGSFTTYELCTQDSNKGDFDLLKIRTATPIKIEIDQGDMRGLNDIGEKYKNARSQIEIQARNTEIKKFLIRRSYDEGIAGALAKAFGKFSPVFYTKAAKFSLDSQNGFQLDVEFLNFIDLDNKGIDFG